MVCIKSFCEEPNWLTGVSGVCNNITGRCECPSGYSGRDIVFPAETCTTNEEVFHILNVVFFAVTLLSAIFACRQSISTCINWQVHVKLKKYLCGHDREEENRRSKSFASDASKRYGHGRTSMRKSTRTSAYFERRKSWIVASTLTVSLNPLLHLPYAVVAAFDPPAAYHHPLVRFAQALALSTLPVGLWLVAYAYYLTLPDLARLRRILQVDSFLFNRDRGR